MFDLSSVAESEGWMFSVPPFACPSTPCRVVLSRRSLGEDGSFAMRDEDGSTPLPRGGSAALRGLPRGDLSIEASAKLEALRGFLFA
jgi:hypothetical protein